jgi:hypothetical protein
MKPQITMQDFGGKLSEDMDATRARLIKGGSWKKQRIVLILPAGASIPAKVALTHWNLIFPPNQGVVRILAQGMEVGEAYSNSIEQVLAHPDLSQFEYILTIEHDNCPPPDGVIKLLERMEEHPEFACIGGLYFTKGEGGVAQIWGDPADPVVNFRPQVPKVDTLQECCGTGMGFNLFRLSMFKDPQLRKPWFHTQTAGGVGTQDLYFWTDARKYGYRCAIDTSVRVGHYDVTTDITW